MRRGPCGITWKVALQQSQGWACKVRPQSPVQQSCACVSWAGLDDCRAPCIAGHTARRPSQRCRSQRSRTTGMSASALQAGQLLVPYSAALVHNRSQAAKRLQAHQVPVVRRRTWPMEAAARGSSSKLARRPRQSLPSWVPQLLVQLALRHDVCPRPHTLQRRRQLRASRLIRSVQGAAGVSGVRATAPPTACASSPWGSVQSMLVRQAGHDVRARLHTLQRR